MKIHFTILCPILLAAWPALANQDAMIVRLDLLTTINSINPDSSELTVMLNTPTPTADRLDKLAKNMDGRMEQYASGQINGERFQQATGHR